MKRLYENLMEEHLDNNRQMLFLSGPRQVGKTTASLFVAKHHKNPCYFNWDIQEDRLLITKGADKVAEKLQLNSLEAATIVVFDELHKYAKWKNFIKGFFDKYADKVKIIVTGSAKLNVYKAGGDSLMGRYFPYRLHPLSVGEIASPLIREEDIAPKGRAISEEDFEALFNFGGFPEPYLRRKSSFYTRWKRLRQEQLFREDLRDLTRIQEMGQMDVLAELLQSQSGQLTNYASLAEKVNVSPDTIKRWIKTLQTFYYCFSIAPWTKNITRSLIKEPKIYLWDWALIKDKGARVENFVASHLLKAVHFWTDRGLGDYGLYFLRDKEKREVDFLVTKNNRPWFIVEVKSSQESLSKSLFYFQAATKAPHAFQIVFDKPFCEGNTFAYHEPTVVPARTFLSQLI